MNSFDMNKIYIHFWVNIKLMNLTIMNVSSGWRKTYRRATTVNPCRKTRQRGKVRLRGRRSGSSVYVVESNNINNSDNNKNN